MNLDAPLRTYTQAISRELARAEAREHAYRPALKALLEALKPGFQAINEPAHIDVGAPDFIVLDGQSPIGFAEAKDIGEDDLPPISRAPEMS